jgi:hypothetical protein
VWWDFIRGYPARIMLQQDEARTRAHVERTSTEISWSGKHDPQKVQDELGLKLIDWCETPTPHHELVRPTAKAAVIANFGCVPVQTAVRMTVVGPFWHALC